MRNAIRRAALAALFVVLPGLAAAEPRIAIIIDDLGYGLEAGQRALALPGPVAFGILPSTPHGRALAELAHESGKAALLHLPLQSMEGQETDEPGGIRLDMSRAELAAAFAAGLESVPYAIGVNSHRGSLLTRHPGHMAWLMAEIGKHDELFFVDSYTTHHSIALSLAGEAGIPAVRRDVFLDPDRESTTVEREFARLKSVATRNGYALGIGHPYPATMALLERELPRLADEGFELVGIVRYLADRAPDDLPLGSGE